MADIRQFVKRGLAWRRSMVFYLQPNLLKCCSWTVMLQDLIICLSIIDCRPNWKGENASSAADVHPKHCKCEIVQGGGGGSGWAAAGLLWGGLYVAGAKKKQSDILWLWVSDQKQSGNGQDTGQAKTSAFAGEPKLVNRRTATPDEVDEEQPDRGGDCLDW